ncbi:MAG: EamA family transporter, partial [Acidimicrobiales bacterium]
MDAAIVLALVAGAGWAINIVVVRWALDRTGASSLSGAVVGVTVAALVALGVAVLSGQPAPSLDDTWRFALVGAIAPGSSQGLFFAAIGSIGPSRSSVLVGTAPMFSVLLAIVFLDESWSVPIIVGTILTVVGGAVISWQPGPRLLQFGALLALATAVTFAIRDVVASHFAQDSDLTSWWAGAVVLGAAALVLAVSAAVKDRGATLPGLRRALPEFIASGVMIGIALPVLLEALDRGQVGVVAPLSNAAQNVAVVLLSAAVFG